MDGLRAGSRRYDALVALGVVIRGGTPALRLRVPGRHAGPDKRVGVHRHTDRLGVLACDDEAQALDRAGLPGSHEDKGHEAVPRRWPRSSRYAVTDQAAV